MKRSPRRSLFSLFRRKSRPDYDRRRPESRGRRSLGLEVLEDRTLLAADPLVLPTITLTVSVGDVTGDIPFETLPHLAPVTVENFANYVEDGDYINSIFHRLDKTPGQQVIQSGWLTSPTKALISGDQFSFVPTDPPIVNESDTTERPNVRAAVGMARTSDPNSATSQFYINTADNPGFDQPLNPDGFAVFANVTDLTMVDLIASLDVTTVVVDIPPTPAFPLTTVPVGEDGAVTNLVRIEEVAATGTVHGTKFNDRDGDGIRDDGEEGVEGAIIFVDSNGDGDLDDGEARTVTNSDGRYAFSLALDDADAQDFIIREADDQRFIQTSPAAGFHLVTVRPGLDTDEVDFGNQLRPIVEIEATDPDASEEGPDDGTFRIFISNADAALVPETLQVFFTVGGTATQGVDYELDDDFVFLGSDNTSTIVTITPVDDSDPESDETVVLTLAAVEDSYVTGVDEVATVTIADNDQLPVVEIEATDPTATEEGPTPGTFRIFIANADTAMVPDTLQVFYTVGGTADESVDYVLADNFVILGSGQTSATVEIVPIDDDETEGDETVELTLTPVADEYNVGANESAIVTIIDNEVSASLSGFVYLDVNANDTMDEGDTPIGGVTVLLEGPNGFAETQVTAVDGSYFFDELAAGDYTLTEDPDGELRQFLEDGGDTVGSQGGTVDSEEDEISINDLPADETGTGNNYGDGPRLGQFFSKRDFLSSTPEANILAAVDTSPDETQWFSVDESWQNFADIEVLLSDDLTEVTLTVTDADDNTQTTTIETSDVQKVRFLGNSGDTFLISIAGEPADYGFTVPAAAPAGFSQNSNSQNVTSSRPAVSIPDTTQPALDSPILSEAEISESQSAAAGLASENPTQPLPDGDPAASSAFASPGNVLIQPVIKPAFTPQIAPALLTAAATPAMSAENAFATQLTPRSHAPLASEAFYSVIYSGSLATGSTTLDVGRNVLPAEEESNEEDDEPQSKEEETASDEDTAPFLGLTDMRGDDDIHAYESVENVDGETSVVSYDSEVPDGEINDEKTADETPAGGERPVSG